MSTSPPLRLERALRAAVSERREELHGLAAALVRIPTVLGAEEGAQRIVASRLETAGFAVERVQPDAAEALADPEAGYPWLSYEGRTSVAARLPGSGGGRSLHLSGHVDVVPVEHPDRWTHDPWGGVIADGRLWGRGAGDMKGGLAAYVIAAEAVAAVGEDLPGDLLVSSVIEEECGGNGMWSVVRAGYDADATLIGESSGLRLDHAATGVVWARLIARGAAGHAMVGGREGPFDHLCRAFGALRRLEAERNRPVRDPVFAAAAEWPYGTSIGKIGGGVWTASTPAELVASVRVGFGRDVEPAAVQEEIRAAVGEATAKVEVAFEGFRARAHFHDPTGPWPDLVAASHRAVVGTEAGMSVAIGTNDGRYVRGPSLCYGPHAGNLHGDDEWVDLESLLQVAEVVAVAAGAWLASER
jgi:acetylornithine deacetylase